MTQIFSKVANYVANYGNFFWLLVAIFFFASVVISVVFSDIGLGKVMVTSLVMLVLLFLLHLVRTFRKRLRAKMLSHYRLDDDSLKRRH